MEEKIGFRVKQARLNAGLTQEELAEKANMSSSFISRLENGKILPSIKKLLMLADIMNVGLEDLLRDFFVIRASLQMHLPNKSFIKWI